jgi:hypothetical protein
MACLRDYGLLQDALQDVIHGVEVDMTLCHKKTPIRDQRFLE